MILRGKITRQFEGQFVSLAIWPRCSSLDERHVWGALCENGNRQYTLASIFVLAVKHVPKSPSTNDFAVSENEHSKPLCGFAGQVGSIKAVQRASHALILEIVQPDML